jgi:hypothetical protein
MSATTMRRPSGVTLLVILCDIGALLGLIGVVSGLLLMGREIGIGAPGMAVAGGALLLILMCVGIIVLGHFLWEGWNWARIAWIVLLVLNTLRQIPGLVSRLASGAQPLGGDGWAVSALEVLVGVLFLLILNSRATRDYCKR